MLWPVTCKVFTIFTLKNYIYQTLKQYSQIWYQNDRYNAASKIKCSVRVLNNEHFRDLLKTFLFK